jgi:hypothetical protein
MRGLSPLAALTASLYVFVGQNLLCRVSNTGLKVIVESEEFCLFEF